MTEILGIESPQETQTFDLSTIQETSAGNNESPEVSESAVIEQVKQTDEILDALIAAIAPAHVANKYLKIFIYGLNGCGKTIFSAQAPGVLIADCDKEGSISLLNFEQLRDTKVLPVKSIFAVEQLVDRLAKGVPQLDWVETLVVDPFSELMYKGLDEQVRAAWAESGGTRNQYLPEGPEYNINTEHMRQLGDALRNLDRNVILTAHVVEKEDKKTGRTMIRSNLTPKLATTIAGMVSLVGYMQYDADTNTRTLQTAPTASIAAKSRLALPPVMENPSFNSILDAFNKVKEVSSNV